MIVSMRDSGVEWLGKVPASWQVMRLKHALARNDSGVWGEDPSGTEDTIVLRSTEQTADGRWLLSDPAYRSLSASDKAAATLEEGDLLVTKSSGSPLHIGKTTLVDVEVSSMGCCYSNFMQRLRPNQRLNPKLAWYVLNNELARQQLDLASNSSTGLANLNSTILGNIWIVVPSIEEQRELVVNLDHTTTRIDTLIAKKTRFIELLREKRQALITHTVTKGLDAGVPMKDSGVEWLGEVPAHWSTGQLGKVAVARCDGPFGSGLKSNHYTDHGVRVVRLQNIGLGFFEPENAAYISHDYWRVGLGSAHEVLAGDLLMAGLGDDNNPLGRACVAPSDIVPALVKADCYRFRLGPRVDSYYVAYTLSATARAECGFLANGATRDRLNLGFAASRMIPIPPLAEQQAIVIHLDRATSRIDTLIAKTERSIELLREHRTALITAAVTGKINLRNAA